MSSVYVHLPGLTASRDISSSLQTFSLLLDGLKMKYRSKRNEYIGFISPLIDHDKKFIATFQSTLNPLVTVAIRNFYRLTYEPL
ncbi:MAG: hypothetical protein JNK90_11975 [Planctomycetaceae bacterium]|nr:hypothetical protein [Planctomycetaceae bacterium]